MLKGCQKKIIFLKDTGSDFFEEAYFVIKNEYEGMNDSDIISEATKIANGICQEKNMKLKHKDGWKALFLSIGMLIGAIISIGCFFLFV